MSEPTRPGAGVAPRVRAFAPGTFTFVAGIEDTCVYPPAHFAMAPLDEHELTGHDRAWREDLDTVAALGATALRYGVDWPRVHVAPGVFDWAVLDERLAYAASLGITVIADLVHYGTPTWLEQSFADPGYPAAVASFAGAFAGRYAGVVDHVTPLNEPITTASFAGLRGVWPPALTGWDGWTRVVLGIAAGLQQSVAAVRSANPDAVIVHVEASSLVTVASSAAPAAASSSRASALVAEAAMLEALGFLPTDLVLGRVDAMHPSHAWLLSHGASAAALDELVDGAVTIDVLGVNYYPDLSPRRLEDGPDGTVQHAHDRWTEGLVESLTRFDARYGLPMVVTETSIEGDDAVRSAWVRDSVVAVRSLADAGVDVRGWTWWPVFDFVDWSYASGGRNVEEFTVAPDVVAERTGSGRKTPYLRRMGLVRLEEQLDGTLVRVPTAAAEAYRTAAG
ncbi:family 1 glycosylhydrolase [Curtobacterium sp. MCLR17_007]|uniref:family 1 glycosylhydrolase n=1 Tax=Curtobacterium sp. MCLR17_007 TaxID=2175648 RepID=UPI000DA7080B|nr:family 1 glycosylhydrolase [Curtobacterium sp. MCLR17_007]WIB60958.1 family 1 glycosylhydrolase [Curtobacterium sp. MCLR17_007]